MAVVVERALAQKQAHQRTDSRLGAPSVTYPSSRALTTAWVRSFTS